MDLMETLRAVKDQRENSKSCVFNGFLEDYLNLELKVCEDALERIVALEPECRIMTNYSVFMNPQLISNKVICYKDILKVPKWYIKAPIVLYAPGDFGDFALVLYDRNYLETKGLYYLLTESGAVFEPFRNNVVCLPMDDVETIVSIFEMLQQKPSQAQMFQREQDRRHFSDLETLEKQAVALGKQRAIEVQESFEREPASRAGRIYNSIVSWYLLKKMTYVQVMMDKDALYKKSNNDIKVHRKLAKQMCTNIEFIAFRDMWRQ